MRPGQHSGSVKKLGKPGLRSGAVSTLGRKGISPSYSALAPAVSRWSAICGGIMSADRTVSSAIQEGVGWPQVLS